MQPPRPFSEPTCSKRLFRDVDNIQRPQIKELLAVPVQHAFEVQTRAVRMRLVVDVEEMARRMVTEFGFSKNIGPFSYAGLPDRDRQPGNHPEAIAEAREIIKEIECQCLELLQANRNALDRLTAKLLERETVSGEVVDECLAPEVTTPSLVQ